MKKVIIFTDGFLPGFKGGGPITSIANLVDLLNNYFDILICTRNHDVGEKDPYQNIVSDKVIKYQHYNVIYLTSIDVKSISNVMASFNPDLIYLNSFFSKTTQLVMFLNKFFYKRKMILAPRGELQANALSIKKTKKNVYLFIYKLLKLSKGVYFHSTDYIETKSIESMFSKSNIFQLQNAVKIQRLEPLTKQENELKIIFVSRVSRKKNLDYALKLFFNIKNPVTFDIYGPKEDISYWSECEEIINQLPENIKVSYKGNLTQPQIISKMREYHVFLFPTLSENFGHVIVESMQAGLIPVISDQTPWIDLDTINAGWDIKLDKQEKYIKVINDLYMMNKEEYTQKSLNVMRYIHNRLDMQKLAEGYKTFFDNIIKGR